MEPVWSAGSVGWCISRAWDLKCVDFFFPVVSYFFADSKEAVHEDKDGKLVLFTTVLLMNTCFV